MRRYLKYLLNLRELGVPKCNQMLKIGTTYKIFLTLSRRGLALFHGMRLLLELLTQRNTLNILATTKLTFQKETSKKMHSETFAMFSPWKRIKHEKKGNLPFKDEFFGTDFQVKQFASGGAHYLRAVTRNYTNGLIGGRFPFTAKNRQERWFR